MSQPKAKEASSRDKFHLLWAFFSCMNISVGYLFFAYNFSIFNSVLPYLGKYVFPTASSGVITFIASAPVITAAIAALFSGYLATRFGRKNVTIVSDIIAIIGVALCLVASLPVVIIGRLLIGINCGITTVVAPLYFTEMPPVEYRGPLSSGPPIMSGAGALLAFALGLLVPNDLLPGETSEVWRILQGISMAMVVFRSANLLIFFRYDTPTYYVSRNMLDEARISLSKIYKEGGVEPRLQELIRERDFISSQGQVKITELFTKKYRKPLFIGVVMMSMQHVCGLNIMMVFSKTIFSAGIEDPNNKLGEHLSIALAAVWLFCGFLTIWTLKRFNRKRLLVFGLLGMGIIELIYGVIGLSTSAGNLAGKIILIFWSIPYIFSMGSVFVIIVAETLPELGFSLAFLANWICGFLTVQFFPDVSDHIEYPGSFLILAGCCIAAGLYFWLEVVETKGVDRAVILQKYSGEKVQPQEAKEVEVARTETPELNA